MKNRSTQSKRFCRYKKGIIIALVCVLLVGFLLIIPKGSRNSGGSQEVSDVFYLQIYDDNGQIVSIYQVSLTGEVADECEILSVTFDCVTGDECETAYRISGSSVAVTVTHPVYGYLTKNIVLDTDGEFSVLF